MSDKDRTRPIDVPVTLHGADTHVTIGRANTLGGAPASALVGNTATDGAGIRLELNSSDPALATLAAVRTKMHDLSRRSTADPNSLSADEMKFIGDVTWIASGALSDMCRKGAVLPEGDDSVAAFDTYSDRARTLLGDVDGHVKKQWDEGFGTDGMATAVVTRLVGMKKPEVTSPADPNRVVIEGLGISAVELLAATIALNSPTKVTDRVRKGVGWLKGYHDALTQEQEVVLRDKGNAAPKAEVRPGEYRMNAEAVTQFQTVIKQRLASLDDSAGYATQSQTKVAKETAVLVTDALGQALGADSDAYDVQTLGGHSGQIRRMVATARRMHQHQTGHNLNAFFPSEGSLEDAIKALSAVRKKAAESFREDRSYSGEADRITAYGRKDIALHGAEALNQIAQNRGGITVSEQTYAAITELISP